MLRDLRQIGELYFAWRILKVFSTIVAVLAVLFVPTWILVDIAVGAVILAICLFPLAVVWAFIRLVRGFRDSSY